MSGVVYGCALVLGTLTLMSLMGHMFRRWSRRMRESPTKDFYVQGWWAIPIWLSRYTAILPVAFAGLLLASIVVAVA